tara:strand:+ start:385 stop:603 length:219 start_codon:yes stop_codon:yes gene_type:complete
MKKTYIILLAVVLSFGFSRNSNKHTISASPCDLSYQNQREEVSNAGPVSEDSLKWKRRHKKRKKSRRPQRGR